MTTRLLLVLAVLLHLAAGVLYAGAGLVVPGPVVLLLWAAWIGLLVGLVRLWRRNPPLSPLVPLGAVALIYGVVTVGEQALGWTA